MNKPRFCLVLGGLAWGGATGLVFAIVMAAARDTAFLRWYAISGPLFFLGGWLWWGPIMWKWLERKHKG